MVLAAIKKYPSQITSAFKRFPTASAFTFLIFITLVIETNLFSLFDKVFGDNAIKFFTWLAIYPIAALIISLTTSLVQESRKSTDWRPQAIASGSWFVLSLTLVFALFDKSGDYLIYFGSAIALVYITASLGFFFAPFWKERNENGVWNFLQKSFKAAVIAILVSAILLGAIEGFVFGFEQLFDADFDSEFTYLNIFYFCASVVAPILFFTKIPSIEECLEETPALSKFAASTIRFLFIPVIVIGTLLFYAYILKFIALWYIPGETPSYFVIGFMIYMLVLVTVMYPIRLAAEPSFEKRFIKIIPAACLPLVILMSIDINNMISKFGIDTEYIYAIALNIYFYAIIAILLIEKINRKMRYIAIVFCAMFFLLTQTPFSAPNINEHIWKSSIENALAVQGYSKFPLSEEDTKNFIFKLKESKDSESQRTLSRLISLEESNNIFIITHFSTSEMSLNNLENLYREKLENKACCNKDTTEKFESFEADIRHPKNEGVDIPKGAKEAINLDLNFDSDDIKFEGDTLVFWLSLFDNEKSSDKKVDSTKTKNANADTTKTEKGATANKTSKADSTKSDKDANEKDSKYKTYTFRITKQELQQDTLKTIVNDRVTLSINKLHAEQWSEKGRSLRIEGILFIK
ncbi:MAG: DUF4153 domain-containing protein [Fibrobacter sp.]|uniref:DUF4153 domain-containing protein n=1 Tax=Fibrobacter sp. TaxID=35828 RepID=UPI0025B8C8CF|nr:DUF4153 domain-containing protein [Fibrobacter sp.]MBQ7079260.1 DUF4153 domain-containing protein [Fibrobacter sp.]